MKTCSFKTLHDLVSNIDKKFEESYPILFQVDGRDYACGITWNEEKFFLIKCNSNINLGSMEYNDYTMLECKHPQINYDEIGRMLTKKCAIFSNSIIKIDYANSFDGQDLMI